MEPKLNLLRKLLEKYFSELDKHGMAYCVIGNYTELPEFTSNDVDLWVRDVRAAQILLQEVSSSVGLKLYMLNKTSNGSNNYFFGFEGEKIKIVKIDLMRESAYKSMITIVPSQLIERNITQYKNIPVANSLIENVMHLLYPLTTHSKVTTKYREKLAEQAKSVEYENIIIDILGEDLARKLLIRMVRKEWQAVEIIAPLIRRQLIYRFIMNMDTYKAKLLAYFIASVLSRSLRRNGIVIALTGIDGVGKSSIKNTLIQESDKYFVKSRNMNFYWRPFVLPRLSKIVGRESEDEVYDSSGKRVVSLTSGRRLLDLAKYIYYAGDFILGKFKYFRTAHTGGVVIFDRYHIDNVVYPERFGFKLGPPFMRFFEKYIIPQPDLLFYLTTDTEILLQRKQELDRCEIEKQKKLYEAEISGKKNVLVIDTNSSLGETTNEILSHCFTRMHDRLNSNG